VKLGPEIINELHLVKSTLEDLAVALIEMPFLVHQPDVLVVGSGPIGATYARKLVEANYNTLMIDMGAQYENLNLTSGSSA
jgi:NADPH-dependent 2,4-dienoyl-CoA reductase/sulfur reductase-like enzyme